MGCCSERLDQKAQKLGDYLAEKLQKLTQYGVVREIRGKGLLLGVELIKDMETMAPYPELGQALKRTTLQNGLILRVDPSWFAVAPALIATESDIDQLADLIEKSLVDALKQVRT